MAQSPPSPVRDRIERFLTPLGRKFNFRFYFLRFMDYYWALPERKELVDRLWDKPSEMAGVRMDDDRQLQLLDSFVRDYSGEFDDRPAGADFGSVDHEVLHCTVRRYKPRRVIEVGSGNSTRVIANALLKNAAEGSPPAHFTAIEPHPWPVLKQGFPGLSELRQCRVQDVSLDTFTALDANDILFIDSSHVLHIASDVRYEILEILPRMKPGVVVHIHDIFLPADYHKHWVLEGRFWAEQYLLQAFLAFNDSFEILWGGQYMHLKHPGALAKAFHSYRPDESPSSFWIRRTR